MRKYQFTGWVSVDDALRADTLVSPKKQRLKFLLIFAAIIFFAVIIVPKNISPKERLSIIGLILFTLFNILWISKNKTTKLRKKYYTDRIQTTRHGYISEESIYIFTVNTERKIEWDHIIKAIHTDTLILLILNKTEYLAFAPNMFESNEDWLAFDELIRKKISV
jgi:hypothetical protein